MTSLLNSKKSFNEEITPILFKVVKMFDREGIFPNLFYESSITKFPNRKNATNKSNYKPMTLMNIHAKSSTLSQLNPVPRGIYVCYAGMIQHTPTNKWIHHINKLKNSNCMVKSIDSDEASEKMQHLFMIKTLSKLDIEGTILNTIKTIHDKLTASIILNYEKLQAFPLRSGNRQRCQLSPLIFNIVLKVLGRAVRQEKK